MFKNLDLPALGLSGTQSQMIESALSSGFKGIDLDMVEFAAEAKAQGLPKARRLLDSARLKIGSFRLPIDWHGDDAGFAAELERIGELAALAKELNCTRAVTLLEPASDERPYHQNFEFHRQRLATICKKLEPAGVRLAVGIQAAPELRANRAFQFVCSFDALQMLLGMVQAKNLGVVVDTWDLFAGGGSLDAVKRLPVDKVLVVRLSDAASTGSPGEWQPTDRTLPGESGAIDSVALLGMLADIGYDGPVTPVSHVSRMQGKRREEIVKLAGQSLDTVWKAAGLTPAGKRAPAPAQR